MSEQLNNIREFTGTMSQRFGNAAEEAGSNARQAFQRLMDNPGQSLQELAGDALDGFLFYDEAARAIQRHVQHMHGEAGNSTQLPNASSGQGR